MLDFLKTLFSMLLVVSVVGSVFANSVWDGGGADNRASTPENWAGDTAPGSGANIVLDATSSKDMEWDIDIALASWTQTADYTGTVTVMTKYSGSFTELAIQGDCIVSNGVWTHEANPQVNYEVNRLNISVGGDFVVGPDAVIDVTGKGYGRGFGPGTDGGSGASHGGTGGRSTGGTISGGPCYGSMIAPTNLGSGGNWGADGQHRGGGAVRLDISGDFQHDGTILACGDDGAYYVPSGGSVFITASSITGAGTIRASGASATGHSRGGGGRIAIILAGPGSDFSGFSGPIQAFSGDNAPGAHAGTIYLEKTDDEPGRGQLILDNTGGSTHARAYLSAAQLAGTHEFSRITLTNGARIGLEPDSVLVSTNSVIESYGSADGVTLNGGTVIFPDEFACSNMFLRVHNEDSVIIANTINMETNSLLLLNELYTMNVDLIVSAGASIRSELKQPLHFAVDGNLTIHEGGSITMEGMGYEGNEGPGTPGSGNSHGGSYGGRGTANTGGASLGLCYGSIIAPTNMGSGGGSHSSRWGGGAVRVEVSGAFHNDGLICANGRPTSHYTGSGGSIYLTVGSITGGSEGVIRANGAPATGNTTGGGGRVAVIVTNAGMDFSMFSNNVTAFGGATSLRPGSAGTVYMQSGNDKPGRGIVIVDNDNLSAWHTDVPPEAHDIPGESDYARFFIRNGARLRLTDNYTVGDITLDETAELDLNGFTLRVNSLGGRIRTGDVVNYGEIIWLEGSLLRFF